MEPSKKKQSGTSNSTSRVEDFKIRTKASPYLSKERLGCMEQFRTILHKIKANRITQVCTQLIGNLGINIQESRELGCTVPIPTR